MQREFEYFFVLEFLLAERCTCNNLNLNSLMLQTNNYLPFLFVVVTKLTMTIMPSEEIRTMTPILLPIIISESDESVTKPIIFLSYN